MQVFLDGQVGSWKEHGIDAELIVVEWNPPEDQLRLKDALTWPRCMDRASVRIIEVPNEIHKQFDNWNRIPLFEYAAKNVGIRRANGEYVLTTNPDLLFSRDLMKFLASRRLSPDCFYRVDRFDVAGKVPFEADMEDRLNFCIRHTSRVNVRGGTIELCRPPVGLGRIALGVRLCLHHAASYMRRSVRIEDKLHTNASGDFLLMSRDHWHKLRGFPELPTYLHMDSYLCVMAASAGLKQIVLPTRMRVYHQEHDRPADRSAGLYSRPVTSYRVWVQQSREMLRRGKPMVFNDQRWGLGQFPLKEYLPHGSSLCSSRTGCQRGWTRAKFDSQDQAR
jgi:GT2 family glycosyltransferase